MLSRVREFAKCTRLNEGSESHPWRNSLWPGHLTQGPSPKGGEHVQQPQTAQKWNPVFMEGQETRVQRNALWDHRLHRFLVWPKHT